MQERVKEREKSSSVRRFLELVDVLALPEKCPNQEINSLVQDFKNKVEIRRVTLIESLTTPYIKVGRAQDANGEWSVNLFIPEAHSEFQLPTVSQVLYSIIKAKGAELSGVEWSNWERKGLELMQELNRLFPDS